MITDFESCRNVSDTEEINRYLFELCEKLNVAFSFLESEIKTCAKYDNGTARPDSISVNGGEAEIDSHGEVLSKSLKTNTLDVYSQMNTQSLDAKNILFPNGIEMEQTGLIIKALWSAGSTSEYADTGESITLSAPAENYRFYLVRVSNSDGSGQANTYIPCVRLGTYIRGINGFCSADSLNIFVCAFTISGNTAQVVGSKAYFPVTGRLENRKITRFYAVI